MCTCLITVSDNEVKVIGFVACSVFFLLTWSFLRGPRAIWGAQFCPQLAVLACKMVVVCENSPLSWCDVVAPSLKRPWQSSLLLCLLSLPHPAQLLSQVRGHLDFSICFAFSASPWGPSLEPFSFPRSHYLLFVCGWTVGGPSDSESVTAPCLGPCHHRRHSEDGCWRLAEEKEGWVTANLLAIWLIFFVDVLILSLWS